MPISSTARSGPILLAAMLYASLPTATPAATTPVLPDFAAAVFTPSAPITNLYFPLGKHTKLTLVAKGTDPDGEPIHERSELRFGGPGPVIAGVETTTMVDRAFESGLLVEETFDHFAQDDAGNVWYMGEDVTNYHYDDNGNLIGTDSASSWRAGVNAALPGFAMPADLTLGFTYYQEYAAADGALDQGMILEFVDHLDLPGGSFDDVLKVYETSALDPNLKEIKYYGPGIGLIRADEGIDADYRNPDLVFELVAPVPVPATLPLIAGGLAALGFLCRRRPRV